MKVGFLHGRGDLGQAARLDLELVDQTYVPERGETVVTWGSQAGAPYVSGVPVGRVESVYASPRETTQRAVIEPFVDFSALDVVGVVVPILSRRRRIAAARRGHHRELSFTARPGDIELRTTNRRLVDLLLAQGGTLLD